MGLTPALASLGAKFADATAPELAPGDCPAFEKPASQLTLLLRVWPPSHSA